MRDVEIDSRVFVGREDGRQVGETDVGCSVGALLVIIDVDSLAVVVGESVVSGEAEGNADGGGVGTPVTEKVGNPERAFVARG